MRSQATLVVFLIPLLLGVLIQEALAEDPAAATTSTEQHDSKHHSLLRVQEEIKNQIRSPQQPASSLRVPEKQRRRKTADSGNEPNWSDFTSWSFPEPEQPETETEEEPETEEEAPETTTVAIAREETVPTEEDFSDFTTWIAPPTEDREDNQEDGAGQVIVITPQDFNNNDNSDAEDTEPDESEEDLDGIDNTLESVTTFITDTLFPAVEGVVKSDLFCQFSGICWTNITTTPPPTPASASAFTPWPTPAATSASAFTPWPTVARPSPAPTPAPTFASTPSNWVEAPFYYKMWFWKFGQIWEAQPWINTASQVVFCEAFGLCYDPPQDVAKTIPDDINDPYYLNALCITTGICFSDPPSKAPSEMPTISPSMAPSESPSEGPTNLPSVTPTLGPTNAPSVSPTNNPTNTPSFTPTDIPSILPSPGPTTTPSSSPSQLPSNSPTTEPSFQPSVSQLPTSFPSSGPSLRPSISRSPTQNPTRTPSASPSTIPSEIPTQKPKVTLFGERPPNQPLHCRFFISC